MIPLTKAVSEIDGSRTLALNAKAIEIAKTCSDFISLTVGEPDFTPPQCVIEAVERAIKSGACRYTAVVGRPELLKKVRDYFANVRNIPANGGTKVIASNGCIQAIFNTLMATLNPGDEVLLPQPYWSTYTSMIKVLGGVVKPIQTTAAANYKITPDQLAEAITPKTKWLIFTNPHNPTGVTYTEHEQRALGEELQKHKHVGVLCDEIYSLLLHDGSQCVSFARANPDLVQRTVVVDGVSKSGALSGWRLGFAHGPEYLIDAMGRIQSQQTSNPSLISQIAAEALLDNGFEYLNDYNAKLAERAVFMKEFFSKHGIPTSTPTGAYYIFVDLSTYLHESSFADNDEAFVLSLMENEHLCFTPGSYFGAPGHVRISLTNGVDVLGQAVERLLRNIK